jgi:hypothetical protein
MMTYMPGIDVCAAVYQHLSYLVVAVGNGQVKGGQPVVLLPLDEEYLSRHFFYKTDL